ncbi:MAG: estB 3 [Akkermansiaceae bacterium]|nr:estB 3 [Akkermansiaceae bacterium]
MQEFVDAKEIAGSVTLVADEGKVLHLAATGLADLATAAPMKADAIFWIASMTKPVTATAVMMMQEEGKLSVDDPIAKYLPEFADLKDPEGKPVSVTIKQCLTHTSGLQDLPAGMGKGLLTLEDFTKAVAPLPLKALPGAKWEYCQTGINAVGRIVEVVSGESYPDFLAKHLFVPLGMSSTGFYLNEEQAARLATSYKRTPEGVLEKVELPFFEGQPATSRNRYPRANGGLFSDAEDYAKFARMILNGGELDGRRYLKEGSVKQMTTVQTGSLATGFTPGNGWGLGWCVVRQPQAVSATLSAGSFGHGGAYGTQVWIDPVKKRVHLLLIQRSDLPNSDGSEIRRGFQEADSGL